MKINFNKREVENINESYKEKKKFDFDFSLITDKFLKDQTQKNNLNYMSGFLATRLSSNTENAGDLFANRLFPKNKIDFKINKESGYFNQGKNYALSEGVNKDNFKVSPEKIYSRPSLNRNNLIGRGDTPAKKIIFKF